MNHFKKSNLASEQRRQLLTLCRFLSVRISYRFMLLLLVFTGLFLTVLQQTLFAPYGIALVCLLLPSFLNGSSSALTKQKENSEIPLSVLYKRYHYSPVQFTVHRITLILCMLLLLIWHMVQTHPLILFGVSVPLLYLILCLALYPVLSRVLFLILHHRLMNGTM